jgi:hypothetical protein
MSDYTYKPRLGFDIRVRPPAEGDAPVRPDRSARMCEAPGCDRRAALRATKSPRAPTEKTWLCAAHAQEHNRGWNYFAGLSDSEAEAARLAALYGDRPTWAMGRNERARAAARLRGTADLNDSFGLFAGARARPAATPRMREGRVLTRLQVQAFETLGLQVSAKAPDIRRRYAELVRRFHPDANGGDRSAETQLSAVVRAHQLLKRSGIC